MNINPKRRRKNGKFPLYKYTGNMRIKNIKYKNRKITYKMDIIVTMIVDLASIALFSLGGFISLYNRTFIQQNPLSEIKRSMGVKKLRIITKELEISGMINEKKRNRKLNPIKQQPRDPAINDLRLSW